MKVFRKKQEVEAMELDIDVLIFGDSDPGPSRR